MVVVEGAEAKLVFGGGWLKFKEHRNIHLEFMFLALVFHCVWLSFERLRKER